MTEEKDKFFAHTNPKFPADADFSVYPDAVCDPRFPTRPGERVNVSARQAVASKMVADTVIETDIKPK